MKFLTAVAAILCVGASAAFAADSPDVKKITIKKFDVYAIRDKDVSMKGSLFTDYTKTSALKKTDLKESYPASVNCFLFRTNFKTFLVDAGNYDPNGSLISKLATINVKPKTVDYVLLTHLHPDHIGGLVLAKKKKDTGEWDYEAVFPNAKVYLTYEEWKTITKLEEDEEKKLEKDSRDDKKTVKFNIYTAFQKAYNGRIKQLKFGEPVDSREYGVYAVKAVGHTPGHCYYRKGKIRFVGDVVHAVDLQVEYPGYCASFDADKKQAYQTRDSFLKTMSNEMNYVFGAHIPFPGVGLIHEKEGGSYKFAPFTGEE